MEKLTKDDIIEPHEKDYLIEAVTNVEDYIRDKDARVSEEVKVMGDENYIAWSDRLRIEGEEIGIEKGIEALILDNLEDEKTEEQIINKLVKRFNLTEEQSKEYYDKYSKIGCKTE